MSEKSQALWKWQYMCPNCGCISEVTPVYDSAAEKKSIAAMKKHEKIIKQPLDGYKEYDRVFTLCDTAKSQWSSIDKKQGGGILSLFHTKGHSFTKFISNSYPELSKLAREGFVNIYEFSEETKPTYKFIDSSKSKPSPPKPFYNYIITCPNCGTQRKYWKETNEN